MLGNLNIGSLNGAGFMPINLVINPEFTVNQRGAASRTAATGYNYDRWYYDGSSLLQGIEKLNLRNTTYVVSWSGSATCSYSLNAAASSSQGGQTYTSIANGGTLTISSLGSNNLWLKFSGTVSDLTNVMCVPSPAQTPFVPRQYQQELALCQRYAYKISADATALYLRYCSAFCISTITIDAIFQLKVSMRTTPSLTTSGTASNYAVYSGNGVVTPSNTTPTILSSSSTSEVANIQVSVASGLTPGQGAALISNYTAASFLLLTAEL